MLPEQVVDTGIGEALNAQNWKLILQLVDCSNTRWIYQFLDFTGVAELSVIWVGVGGIWHWITGFSPNVGKQLPVTWSYIPEKRMFQKVSFSQRLQHVTQWISTEDWSWGCDNQMKTSRADSRIRRLKREFRRPAPYPSSGFWYKL